MLSTIWPWIAGLSPFDCWLSNDPCLQRLCDDTLFGEGGVLASTAPLTPKPVQNVCQSDASLAPLATTVLLPATRAGVFPRFVNIAGEDA